MTDDADSSTREATSTATHIPDALKQFDIWVCWNGHIKEPLAPWATGHLFPTKWGDGVVVDPDSGLDERPETDYGLAKRVCDLPAAELEHLYSRTPRERTRDPDERDGSTLVRPDTLRPTIILPHEPPNPPIMLVDLDDVRDPATGEITPEARDILERLDAYAEVSSSGSGLHAFVRASLPEGVGRVIAPLERRGHLELYDHGRMVGATWRHVDWTPTAVPERQPEIEALVDAYTDDEPAKPSRVGDGGRPTDSELSTGSASVRTGGSGAGDTRSPYYGLDVTTVADRGLFGRHRRNAPGGEWQGPHPTHGAQSGRAWDDQSSNFSVSPTDNAWYCFLHDVGGGPLELIAVLEGLVDCRHADQLSASPRMLARACLLARDEYATGLDDADPPYRALIGVARAYDLSMKAPEDDVLGRLTYKTARQMYRKLSADDLAP